MKMYNYSMTVMNPDDFSQETKVACGSWHVDEEMARQSMERRKARTKNVVDAWVIHKNFKTHVAFEGKLKRNDLGNPSLNKINIHKLMDDYTETFYGNDVRITIEVLG